MPDLMREKLGAYLDGELQGRKLLEMQAHLDTCPDCRAELNELRQLSHLLHVAPLPEFTPASRFASQLVLQLPRRADSSRVSPARSWIGLLIPTALLLGWVFIQAIGWSASLLSLTGHAGWLNPITAWAHPAPLQGSWFAAAQNILDNSLNLNVHANLGVFKEVGLLLQNLFGLFFWQVVVTLLYLGWLAIWWNGQRNGNGADLVS